MKAVPAINDRTDAWYPVFRGHLVDQGNCVELCGVLRPSWFAWFFALFPVAILALGLLPRVQMRWQIIGLAAALGVLFWVLGARLDRTKNEGRRQAVRSVLARTVGGHA